MTRMQDEMFCKYLSSLAEECIYEIPADGLLGRFFGVCLEVLGLNRKVGEALVKIPSGDAKHAA